MGGLHGDEPSGRQLLLHLADHLCHAYLRHDKASHAAPTAEATASEEGQAQAIGSAQQHETLPRSLRLLLQPQQQRKGEGTPESTGTGVLEHMDWEADATAVHLLRHVRLVLLPDANPDGYQQRQRESMYVLMPQRVDATLILASG